MPEHRRFARMRPRVRALELCIASAVLLAGLIAAVPANGSPTGRPHVRVLAPGVAITTYIDRRFPIRTYVLTVDPSQGASVGVALSNDRLAGLEKTSDIAKRLGAIAAVNGDFGFTSGRPVHPFVLDGDLVQTSRAYGVLFTIAGDGTMRIAKPDKEEITVTEVDSGETWPVATWNNGRPTAGEITAYTAAGTGLDQPRPFTCSARLLPAGPSSPTGDGVTRTYSVDQRGCFSSSLATQDGVVLSAAPATDGGDVPPLADSRRDDRDRVVVGDPRREGRDRRGSDPGEQRTGGARPMRRRRLRAESSDRHRAHGGRPGAHRGGRRTSGLVGGHVARRSWPSSWPTGSGPRSP